MNKLILLFCGILAACNDIHGPSDDDQESSSSDAGTSESSGEDEQGEPCVENFETDSGDVVDDNNFRKLDCVVPDEGAWCELQLEVSKSVGCSTSEDPTSCYKVVASLYTLNDGGVLVEAADCIPQPNSLGDFCLESIDQCLSASCETQCLFFSPDLSICQFLAFENGGVEPQDSLEACENLISVYGE